MNNQINRRAFLSRVSAAAVVTGLSSFPFISAASQMTQQKKLGIALVGLGYYSVDLLMPALEQTQYVKLTGLVTGSPEKAEKYGKKYQIAKENIYNYENFDKITSNPAIDVVYIVLPNSLHKEFVIRAAKAGKHVICEKPMALNAAECREMIDACKKAGVSLSIGYRLHYEPYTQRIQQMAKEKPYGDINVVHASAGFRMGRPTEHWKAKSQYGGGAIMDMGPYPLQAARYSTGLEPIAVTAQMFNSDPSVFKGVDETTTFQLEFPNNIVASCLTSFAANVNFLTINAQKGEYGLKPFSGYGGIHGFLPNEQTFDFPEKHQQASQMDQMCLAIMEKRPSLTPGEEGLRDMVIIDAIRESVKKGGARIELK
ncbi:MAG TPA: Gfo/Idh/MocA family oxidoreductase [Prolixibacteraceae bacterium]|nr:Gfo/Idh/MocA family oxidoreductase [Prolixibacteraceae bacterium]